MAIGTDDSKPKFGTQDSIDDGSTSSIANNAFSVAADITAWTNDEDASFASFVLKLQFDTTMPTAGHIKLFARLINIDGANDPPVPSANYPHEYIGAFDIDFGVAADVDFYTAIKNAPLPFFKTSQEYEFYLQNFATGQTMGASWTLKVNPFTFGPSA